MQSGQLIGSYEPDASELGFINKYGFDVTTSGDRFVVKHPRHKKLGKFEGGNLIVLLMDAAKATDKLEAARPNGLKPSKKDPEPPPTPIILDEEPAHPGLEKVADNEQSAPDEITGAVLDDSGGKVRKARKVSGEKRDPEKAKFYSTFKLWLLYPDKESGFINKQLASQGIETKDSSTIMLRHMCNNCVRALIDLGMITKADIDKRREELLKPKEVLN